MRNIGSGVTARDHMLPKPSWAFVLILVLFSFAQARPGEAIIGWHQIGLALPARWGLPILVLGGYACGLFIGAASARRKPERPSVGTRQAEPMSTFAYEALNVDGKPQKGVVEATTSEEAIQRVKGHGFYPISVREQKARKSDDPAGAS